MKRYDVMVIGGGPGAMSTVLQLSRFQINTLWLSGFGIGGQIANTERVDNLLGFGDLYAYELVQKMYNDVKDLPYITEIKDQAYSLDADDNGYCINDEYYSYNVVIATGTTPREIEIINQDELNVGFCAVCDAPFLTKDDQVIVIGGGQTAFEEAELLSRYVKHVRIVMRNKPRANKTIIDKVSAIDNIEVLEGIDLTSLRETPNAFGNPSLVFGDNHTALQASHVFFAIGGTGNTDFLEFEVGAIDGYIVAPKLKHEAYPGFYAVGDVVYNNTKQIGVAIGDGIKVANKIRQQMLGV